MESIRELLVRQIDWRQADSVAELARLMPGLDQLFIAMTAQRLPPALILAVMADLYDQLTQRIAAIGVAALGAPPCDWCLISLGSAGRREQFARTDQDNALIYAGVGERYFAALAEFVVGGLVACGFARCPGDVMATNPTWRRSLTDWRYRVIDIVSRPTPEQVRLATIFLDFRAVAGNPALADALREQVWVAVGGMPVFLVHLVRDDLSHGVPLGVFHTLRTPLWGEHRGEINLKAEACVHVVDLLRVLSLKHHVAETGTLARLSALVREGALTRDEGAWLETAYETLMSLRIQDAARRMRNGEAPASYLQLRGLTGPDREALRAALTAVDRFQETVGAAFAVGGVL